MVVANILLNLNAGQPTTVSEQELKQAYCNSVQALKDYINASNLLSYDITGMLGTHNHILRVICSNTTVSRYIDGQL